MSDSPRHRLFSVIGIVVGIPVVMIAALVCVAIVGARASMQGFGQLLSDTATTAAAGLKAYEQLRAAADLVVERDPRGGYRVSGKLVPEERHAASAAEVQGVIHALPRRGVAFVTVLEAASLLAPTTAQSKADQRALEELVCKEGFALARGSYQMVPVGSRRRP